MWVIERFTVRLHILWDSGFCSRCGQETEIDCGGYTLHQKVA